MTNNENGNTQNGRDGRGSAATIRRTKPYIPKVIHRKDHPLKTTFLKLLADAVGRDIKSTKTLFNL